MGIVYKTLKKLETSVGKHFHPEAILHSDQGMHYRHPLFQSKVKELGLTQSMSRKGTVGITHQWRASLDILKI